MNDDTHYDMDYDANGDAYARPAGASYPSGYPAEGPAGAHPTHTDLGSASGRHPVNTGHLVMGVAFLGLALVWLLYTTGVISGADLRWFMPMPWLVGGLAGLAAVMLSGRSRRRATS